MTIAEHPARALLDSEHHEQVVIRQDPASGLRFIVAVHSTVLGPSLGGMRLRRYPGGLREALDDVLSGVELRRPETTPVGCSIKWKP